MAFVYLFCLGVRTYVRNFDWYDDRSLFESAIKVNPNNAKLYNNLGHFYEREGDYNRALQYFRSAAKTDSEDIGSELNVARILIELNHTKEAESMLWHLKPMVKRSVLQKRIVPKYLDIWINLARVIGYNDSRLDEAERVSFVLSFSVH